MRYQSTKELEDSLKNVAEVKDGRVKVINEAAARGTFLDRLLFNAVFNENAEIMWRSRWLVKAIAYDLGVRSASIQGLYDAMGRGEVTGFTVPAINIRGLSYDVARAVVRAAKKNNTGSFIFEIARSEDIPVNHLLSIQLSCLQRLYGRDIKDRYSYRVTTSRRMRKNISRTLKKRSMHLKN
jgi:hypothetical protein